MKFNYSSYKFAQFYNNIKNDNIEDLKILLKKYPSMLFYHNKKGRGLLSYALSYGSYKILNYINKNHKELFYTTNNKKRNILEQIIYEEDENSLINIFKVLNSTSIHKYFENKEDIPLLFKAIQTLEQTMFNKFINLIQDYITEEILNYKDDTGLNILHYLAFHNKNIPNSLKEKIPNRLFHEIEINMGNTPLLLSAEYSSNEIFQYLYEHSNINQKNFLNRNILHLSILNKREDNFNYILNNLDNRKIINFSEVDYTENTPLKLAISNRKENIISTLFNYTSNDLSDDLLLLSRDFHNFHKFFNEHNYDVNISKLNGLINNKIDIRDFFSNIFYNADIEFIKNLAATPLWTLLEFIKEEDYLNNKIYASCINGRKDMSKKINFLSKYLDIYHAEDISDKYLYNIENNQLYFYEIDNNDNVKKSFCFVSSLRNLPSGQIKEILENSEIIGDFTTSDWLLLISIIIKKHKYELFDYIPNFILSTSIYLDNNSNLGQAIIDNLLNYNYNPISQKYYELLINQFQLFPNELIKKNIHNTLNKNKELDVFYFFKSPHLKKNLYIEITNVLFQEEKNYEYINKIILKNENLLFYCFKNSMEFSPLEIKNNDIVDYTLSRTKFSINKKNWYYLCKVQHNSKLTLSLLSKTRLDNFEDKKYFQDIISKNPISDETWKSIINHYSKEKPFQFLLFEYFLYYSLSLDEPNFQTFEKISSLIELNKDSTKLFIEKLSIEHSIESKSHYSKLFLKQHTIENLFNSFFEKEDYDYLNVLFKNYNLDINIINLEAFWYNKNMSNFFDLNIFNPSYEPLEKFLSFIHSKISNISNEKLNVFMNEFYTWIISIDLKQETKIKIIEKVFLCFEEQIPFIDDEILINLSNFSVKNFKNSENSLLQKDNNKNINSLLNIVFNQADKKFFEKICKDKEIYDSIDLSDNNKKVFQLHILENLLDKKENNKKTKHKI